MLLLLLMHAARRATGLAAEFRHIVASLHTAKESGFGDAPPAPDARDSHPITRKSHVLGTPGRGGQVGLAAELRHIATALHTASGEEAEKAKIALIAELGTRSPDNHAGYRARTHQAQQSRPEPARYSQQSS